MQFLGDPKSASAVFIHKADDTTNDVWTLASEIRSGLPNDEECHLYRVLTSNGNEFLAALRGWAQQHSDELDQCSLMLYSHGSQAGIIAGERGKTEFHWSNYPDQQVTWMEIRDALCGKVHAFWAVGCSTSVLQQVWPADRAPVSGTMLITSDSRPFSDLLPAFQEEVSLSPVNMPEHMAARVRQRVGGLASYVQFVKVTPAGWKPVPQEPLPDPLSDIDAADLQSLWAGSIDIPEPTTMASSLLHAALAALLHDSDAIFEGLELDARTQGDALKFVIETDPYSVLTHQAIGSATGRGFLCHLGAYLERTATDTYRSSAANLSKAVARLGCAKAEAFLASWVCVEELGFEHFLWTPWNVADRSAPLLADHSNIPRPANVEGKRVRAVRARFWAWNLRSLANCSVSELAYFRWRALGRRHGADWSDWFSAVDARRLLDSWEDESATRPSR
jgi:hypothetical protein